ncbi:hypothetical protein ABPG75_005775 [Micractinium tetrahymenae]
MAPLGGPCRVEMPGGEWHDVNNGLTYTDRVQGACTATLLQFYATKHASSAPIEHWRDTILAGRISVNGQMVSDPQAPVPPNAILEFRRPGWAEPPAPAYLDVLWWDAHVVAVHKPSGLQVLPAGPVHERCTLTLLRRFHKQHAVELKGMPAPVHRLGRGTSGVLICACSEAARSKLSRDFVDHGAANQGRLRKVYRTLVQGLVDADQGNIDVPIGRMEYPGVRGGLYAARPDSGPGAKPSRSHYTVLHRDAVAGTTLVDVEIFTGRPHQIRIHMAALGHPLVGDPLYAPGGLPLPLPSAAAQDETGGSAGERRGGADTAAVAAAAEQQAQGPVAAADGNGRGAGTCSGGSALPQRPQGVVMPGDCGYLLHSRVLEFDHPITGERIVATCLPPPELRLPGEGEHAARAGDAPPPLAAPSAPAVPADPQRSHLFAQMRRPVNQ